MLQQRSRRLVVNLALSIGLVFSLMSEAGAQAEAGAPRAIEPETLATIDGWIDAHLDALVERYEFIHAHPELALEEAETAKLVAKALEGAGYAVQTGLGGHGLVGVLENGPGPAILVRGDMDALPVREETGLAYASQVTAQREDGSSSGVMHACGHDVHVTNLIGTGQLLAEHRSLWSGTLILLGEPAEERGKGALMMIEAGLFDRIPRPDMTIALHVESELGAGQLGYTSGWAGANVDAVNITVHGRGGHGARPHQTIDPITTAAYLITQLQTIVSRRIDPLEPAVVTVGSIHGGHKNNVIPDEVELKLTVRSYSDEVRQELLESIRQLANDTCQSFECPKPPTIWVRPYHTPAVYNDPDLAAYAGRLFASLVGPENVIVRKPSMGGDDFGRFGKVLGVPSLLYRLGSVSRETLRARESLGAAAPPLPTLHSSRFAPDARPTLRTGLRSMSALLISLLPVE